MHHSYARKFLLTWTWTEPPAAAEAKLLAKLGLMPGSLGKLRDFCMLMAPPAQVRWHDVINVIARSHVHTRAQLHTRLGGPDVDRTLRVARGSDEGYVEHMSQDGLDPYSSTRQTPKTRLQVARRSNPLGHYRARARSRY